MDAAWHCRLQLSEHRASTQPAASSRPQRRTRRCLLGQAVAHAGGLLASHRVAQPPLALLRRLGWRGAGERQEDGSQQEAQQGARQVGRHIGIYVVRQARQLAAHATSLQKCWHGPPGAAPASLRWRHPAGWRAACRPAPACAGPAARTPWRGAPAGRAQKHAWFEVAGAAVAASNCRGSEGTSSRWGWQERPAAAARQKQQREQARPTRHPAPIRPGLTSALKKLGWPSSAAEHSVTASLYLRAGPMSAANECSLPHAFQALPRSRARWRTRLLPTRTRQVGVGVACCLPCTPAPAILGTPHHTNSPHPPRTASASCGTRPCWSAAARRQPRRRAPAPAPCHRRTARRRTPSWQSASCRRSSAGPGSPAGEGKAATVCGGRLAAAAAAALPAPRPSARCAAFWALRLAIKPV